MSLHLGNDAIRLDANIVLCPVYGHIRDFCPFRRLLQYDTFGVMRNSESGCRRDDGHPCHRTSDKAERGFTVELLWIRTWSRIWDLLLVDLVMAPDQAPIFE